MAGHTDNSVVINAPLDLVWALTNDLDRWPELFTEYARVETLDDRGTAIRFRLTTHPDDQGRVWSWVSEREPDVATNTVRARRVDTGVFKYMSLFWEYRPAPEGVCLRWVQDFEMKSGSFTDDVGMAARLNEMTRRQLDHIKERVEKAAAEAGRT